MTPTSTARAPEAGGTEAATTGRTTSRAYQRAYLDPAREVADDHDKPLAGNAYSQTKVTKADTQALAAI